MKLQQGLLLNGEKMKRSNGLEKSHGIAVSGKQDMLSVVENPAGCGIKERRRPAARSWFLFQDKRGNAMVCERDRSGKTTHAAANDENAGAVQAWEYFR